mmetsp:Transcript_8390/g.26787  ORF Transcript_8390/g.26787 Transcript_8390/m.26787 type:complete len:228 (-) Transcript_8390:188-871(-)
MPASYRARLSSANVATVPSAGGGSTCRRGGPVAVQPTRCATSGGTSWTSARDQGESAPIVSHTYGSDAPPNAFSNARGIEHESAVTALPPRSTVAVANAPSAVIARWVMLSPLLSTINKRDGPGCGASSSAYHADEVDLLTAHGCVARGATGLGSRRMSSTIISSDTCTWSPSPYSNMFGCTVSLPLPYSTNACRNIKLYRFSHSAHCSASDSSGNPTDSACSPTVS